MGSLKLLKLFRTEMFSIGGFVLGMSEIKSVLLDVTFFIFSFLSFLSSTSIILPDCLLQPNKSEKEVILKKKKKNPPLKLDRYF